MFGFANGAKEQKTALGGLPIGVCGKTRLGRLTALKKTITKIGLIAVERYGPASSSGQAAARGRIIQGFVRCRALCHVCCSVLVMFRPKRCPGCCYVLPFPASGEHCPVLGDVPCAPSRAVSGFVSCLCIAGPPMLGPVLGGVPSCALSSKFGQRSFGTSSFLGTLGARLHSPCTF